MPGIVKFFVLLIVAGLAIGGAMHFMGTARTQGHADAANAAVPPANATYVDMGPQEIMSSVASAKKAQRDEIAASYEGLWVPDSGWESEVVDVTQESNGTAIRMFTTSNGFIGGGYYIVAVCPALDQQVAKGQRARVQGMIKRVEVLPAAAAPMFRILLHNCRLVQVDHK